MELQFTGLDGILANLARLPLEENEENAVVRAGAKVVQKAVKNEAPVDDKILINNIKIKKEETGLFYIHTAKAYHGHLVEFGRSAGSTMAKKKGRLQKVTWGRTNANPFFARGFESSQNEAKQVMANEIRKLKNL